MLQLLAIEKNILHARTLTQSESKQDRNLPMAFPRIAQK